MECSNNREKQIDRLINSYEVAVMIVNVRSDALLVSPTLFHQVRNEVLQIKIKRCPVMPESLLLVHGLGIGKFTYSITSDVKMVDIGRI